MRRPHTKPLSGGQEVGKDDAANTVGKVCLPMGLSVQGCKGFRAKIVHSDSATCLATQGVNDL